MVLLLSIMLITESNEVVAIYTEGTEALMRLISTLAAGSPE